MLSRRVDDGPISSGLKKSIKMKKKAMRGKASENDYVDLLFGKKNPAPNQPATATTGAPVAVLNPVQKTQK